MKVPDFMTFSRSERQQATNKTKKSDTRTHRKKQGKRLEGDDGVLRKGCPGERV